MFAPLKSALMFVVIFATQSYAQTPDYYPDNFTNNLDTLNSESLKAYLNALAHTPHLKSSSGANDSLGCQTGTSGCYQRKILSYNEARKVLFGNLHLQEDQNGFFINDVYCQKNITARQAHVGPNLIPNSNIINAEHTWPQSRFSNKYSANMQKTDLHHLFPTDSKANSTRGNFEFIDVAPGEERLLSGCEVSARDASNRFMPPENHRGDVARSLFYFSVVYKIAINKPEEDSLRTWAEQDPVDDFEMSRNDGIYGIQNTRNPFIDFPDLYKKIADF